MKITLEFDSWDELKKFRGEGAVYPGVTDSAPEQISAPTPGPMPIPVAPAPAPVPEPIPVAPAPAPVPVPTSAPSYSQDDLARAAMGLLDIGKKAELQGLLGQFGIRALPQLAKEQYGAFATALRALGAQI